jgi:hypothetical protein
MGELKGFPAPKGESRLWRVEPTARHAVCGSSPDCQVVAEGFTSIIDLTFGPDGTLYVVELDEEGWLAMEFGQGTGGSVSACNTATWVCTEVATGFNQLTSATVGGDGTLFILTNALIPGAAEISTLLSAAGTPAAIGATAGAGSSANISFAMASNLSPADLTNRGWTCFQPLPDRIVCSRPNQGFPTVGNPPPADRPASFTFLVFNSTGRFVGTEVLLRQDLYCGADIADPSGTCTRHAQLCESTGQPYDFVPVIGYYECVHTAGR